MAASGIVSLVSGRPQDWFIFALHGVAGFWLLLLLWVKLRRVWPRLIHPRRWDRRTVFGLLALLLVLLAIGSGTWWAAGGQLYFAGFNLLNWHIGLGFVLTAAMVFHMFARAKRLRKRDLAGRRQALQFSALLAGSVALWPGQQLAERVLNVPGARRRFTGSYESGSYAGNAFPTSSWVADQPRPLEEARAALLATHAGEEPLSYEHGFPLRLVAPGHRGFEWVKWITRVEVLTAPDPGQVLSIFTSSFTEAGRGK